MANPMKGQARFEAAKKPWTLTFGFNELVSLEDELGVKVDEIGAKLGESARMVRTVFRVCLEAEHGQMTDREAGDLISEIGLQEAAQHIAKAFAAAFPSGSAEAGPPQPASAPARKRPTRGTGKPA
jgi:hypothetical protein